MPHPVKNDVFGNWKIIQHVEEIEMSRIRDKWLYVSFELVYKHVGRLCIRKKTE